MNIEAKFSGDNTIEYKLINLDPNYDRSDRKVQLRLYQLTNAKDCFTEEELAGTNINLQLGNMNDIVVQYKREIISYTEAFKKLYAYNEIRNQEIKNNKIKTHIFTTHELQQLLDGWQTYGYRNDTNTDPKTEDNDEIYTPWNSNKNFYVEVYDLEPEVILPGQSQMLFDIPAKVTETPVYSFTHSYKNIKTLYLLLEATVYYDYSSLMGAPDLKHYIELSEKHKDKVVERFGKKIATSNRVNAKTEIFRIGNLFLSDEYITAGNKSFVDENLEELTPCLLDIKILQEEVEKNKQFFIDTINKYRIEYMDQAGYGDLNAYNNFLEKVVEFAYFNNDYGANLYLYYPFLHLTDIILQPDIIDNWDYSYSNTPYKLVETATVQIGEYFSGDTGDTIDPDQIDKELLDAENITSTPVDTSIPKYDIVINVTPTVSYPDDWLLPSTNVVVNPSASSQYKALFPPILEAYQPAFVGTETSEYEIFFKLSEYTNYEDVAHIDFRITLQSDNTSVVASSSLWHDGIIYKIKSKNDIIDHGNGLYSVKIKTHFSTDGNYDLITGHWQNNTYYKVQARLGTSWSGWENAEQYTTWRNAQAGQGKFSDWSTVMVLKSISKPSVQILNNQNSKLTLAYGDMKTEISSSPLFYGQYNQNNLGGTEFLDTYQFILYDAKTEKELENSGILQNNNILEDHTGSVTVTHRFQTNYEEDKQYKVIFNITTSNGYKDSDEYDFVFFPKPQEEIASLEANAFEEDGIIKLTAITSNLLTGNYVITRKKRNEKAWEELQYVQVINGNIKDSNGNIIQSTNINNFKCYLNIYTDFTPESGVEYVYGIERVRQNDYREKRVLSNNIMVNFEYIFLYANNQQLKLKYNSTIDSFKHTVLSSKQDTLGGKFPYITKNGYTYYAEFPFKALISFNSDENNYFFSEINNNNSNNILTFPVRDQKIYDQYGNIINTIKGISYKNEEQNNMEQQNFSTNLTYDNIYKEKKFREEVEKFLNNTEYKLFRSSTEGNFIINLMDIKFTPETALGRMIYSVSGMAYEMADYNIKNLHQYSILPLGTFNPVYETNIIVAGELQGIYTETDNIINHIKKDIAPKPINKNNYYGVTEFIDITDLCITPYPKIDLNSWFNLQSIIENQTTYVEGLNYVNGTMFYDIDSKQLKYYFDTPENKLHFLSNISDINSFGNTADIYRLETSFKKYNNYMPMKINIDQNKIITVPDTPYILNNQNFISSNTITIEKLREKSNIENEDIYQPVLINYFGRMQIRETDYNILESSFRHTNCNQLSGIFCRTDCNPYFPYLFQDTLEIEKEKIKQINNKNYYNSLNILEIIKEQIRLEIIKERNLTNTKQLQWQNNQMWLDDFTLVNLNSLKNIIIETQLNTKLQIGEQQFLCGPAGLVVPFEALENFNAANFEFHFILPENIQSYLSYYVFATITYDYELSFETYKESRKLFEEESDNNEF